MESLDDLVRQYQNSRERAELERCADEIIDRVGPELSRFIRSHFPSTSRNRDAWKDAFQETLLALITGLPGFPVGEGRCFKSWCYGIARHKVRDQFRGRKTTVNTIVDPELLRDAVLPSEFSKGETHHIPIPKVVHARRGALPDELNRVIKVGLIFFGRIIVCL